MVKNLSKKGIELKECLDVIKSKKRLLTALQRQLAQRQADCDSVRAVDYSLPKVKSSNNTSQEERYVLHLEKIRNRIDELVQEIFSIEDKIATEIQVLNETEQAMIIDRYLHNWSWKRICKEYNYYYTDTSNGAQKLVNRALNKIGREKV